MRIPFVNNDEICARENFFEIEFLQIVMSGSQVRVSRVKTSNGFFAIFRNQVLSAPRICWLENFHVVLAGNQFSRYASKEMGVAVIPVRNKRLIKHQDA